MKRRLTADEYLSKTLSDKSTILFAFFVPHFSSGNRCVVEIKAIQFGLIGWRQCEATQK